MVRGILPFKPGDARHFLIDNVKFAFSPFSPSLRGKLLTARPVVDLKAVTSKRQLGLEKPGKVEAREYARGISWKDEQGGFQQGIGAGPNSSRTLVGDFNPLRAIRSSLSASELRRHDKKPDNYVDPRVIPREKTHRDCLSILERWVEERSVDYCAIVKSLWGLELKPYEVLVSVNVMELAWDAVAEGGARLITKLLSEHWNRAFANSKLAFEIFRTEIAADGSLRGFGRDGEALKLYRKAQDLVRFEVQFSKGNARKMLGHRLDPAAFAEFSVDLAEIASRAYASVLEVQALAATPAPSGLGEVLSALIPHEPARYVMEALLHTGMVKTRHQRDYRVLTRLSTLGVITKGSTKGCWSATHDFAGRLQALERFLMRQGLWSES